MFDVRASVPHKRVRAVSSERYHAMVETGERRAMQQAFLAALVAYEAAEQHWPTLAELVTWAHRHGALPRPDPNLYRPRATELVGSIVEYLPRRICAVTGKQAHPVRLREIGSHQPR